MSVTVKNPKDFVKGQVLRSQARHLVLRVREYFEKEKMNGGVLIPIQKVVQRTAAALQLSQTLIQKISKEKRLSGPNAWLTTPGKRRCKPSPKSALDYLNEQAIRRHIYSYYERKENPTIKKLLKSLRNEKLFEGGKTSLSVVLKNLGFRFKKPRYGRPVLLEKPEIIAWRARFLREFKKIPKGNIVWVTETILPTDLPSEGSAKGNGRLAKYILLHAATYYGFVPNASYIFETKSYSACLSDISPELYKSWFERCLLKNIGDGMTIIIDNKSYQNKIIDRVPTNVWDREEIYDWLERKGVPDLDQSFNKIELMELVKANKSRHQIYELHELAKKYGNKILRLPPHHTHLNAIENVSKNIRSFIAKKELKYCLNKAEARALTDEAIEWIQVKQWKDVVDETFKFVEEATQLDKILETCVDDFVNTAGESGSESCSETSDEYSEEDEDMIIIRRLQAASRKEGETIILDDDDYEDDDNIDESTEGESSCYLPDENSGTVVFAEAHSSLISEVGTTEPEPDVKPTLPHSKRIKRELELTMDTDEESSRTTIADDSDGVVAASPLSDLRMVRIKREAVTGSVPELVTVKQETSEEDTQVSETVEVDEDKKFLDDLLPMIKKLKPSDKAMVKAQIIQLINWRLNSTV